MNDKQNNSGGLYILPVFYVFGKPQGMEIPEGIKAVPVTEGSVPKELLNIIPAKYLEQNMEALKDSQKIIDYDNIVFSKPL